MDSSLKIAPTSLKLPVALKKELDALARDVGQSPHAFMVQALAGVARSAHQRAQFTDDALAAERDMLARGGYALADVERYFQARLRGEQPRKPRRKPCP